MKKHDNRKLYMHSQIFWSNVYIGKARFLFFFKNTIFPTLIYGFFIGITVGTLIFFYNLFAEWVVEESAEIYSKVSQNLAYMPLLILVLVILSLCSFFFIKHYPDSSGSGIPLTEGVMSGKIEYDRPMELGPSIVASSLVTFTSGLPLGSEAPSVTVGGILGLGVNRLGQKIFRRGKEFERLSVTSGAASGFAVALNAPLTGIIYALEEGVKKISAPIILQTATAIIFAVVTSGAWHYAIEGEFRPFIYGIVGQSMGDIQIQYIWMMSILGLVIGFSSVLFSFLERLFKKISTKIKMPLFVKIMICFVLVGIVGVFMPRILGGGQSIIKEVGTKYSFDVTTQTWVENPNNIGTLWLLAILVVRIIIISLSLNAGVTGGLLLPSLCIGALIGGIMGDLFVMMGLPTEAYGTVVVVSMAAFEGCVSRSPLTAMALTVEVTGQLTGGLIMMIFVIVISFFVIELSHLIPFYDETLETIEERKLKNKKRFSVDYMIKVEEDSYVAWREVKEIVWPCNSTIIKIYALKPDGNYEEHSILGGNSMLRPGDVILVNSLTCDSGSTFDELMSLCGSRKNQTRSYSELEHILNL